MNIALLVAVFGSLFLSIWLAFVTVAVAEMRREVRNLRAILAHRPHPITLYSTTGSTASGRDFGGTRPASTHAHDALRRD